MNQVPSSQSFTGASALWAGAIQSVISQLLDLGAIAREEDGAPAERVAIAAVVSALASQSGRDGASRQSCQSAFPRLGKQCPSYWFALTTYGGVLPPPRTYEPKLHACRRPCRYACQSASWVARRDSSSSAGDETVELRLPAVVAAGT